MFSSPKKERETAVSLCGVVCHVSASTRNVAFSEKISEKWRQTTRTHPVPTGEDTLVSEGGSGSHKCTVQKKNLFSGAPIGWIKCPRFWFYWHSYNPNVKHRFHHRYFGSSGTQRHPASAETDRYCGPTPLTMKYHQSAVFIRSEAEIRTYSRELLTQFGPLFTSLQTSALFLQESDVEQRALCAAYDQQ